MKNVQVFKNDVFEVAVRENGLIVEFEAEASAKSLGFIQEKNSKVYVRWERVNDYLSEFGLPHTVGKGDFIPESYVYMLAMKGENDLAVSFQKFIAFDVLPAIRKNKVYIDPSATDQEIDNAVRFATPQKRRVALMEATIDGKSSIFNVYDDIKQYIKRWTADEKIKAMEHVERVLLDKKDTYQNDISFAHKVEELRRIVATDLDKVKNWKNGTIKRKLNKQIEELSDKVDELRPPSIDDYYEVNYPGFSHNYMYEHNDRINKWVKTKAFKNWINNFPYDELPYDTGIDWDKPIKMYLAFTHKKSMDVHNLEKAIIDLLFKHYGYDDNLITAIDNQSVGIVSEHKDGKTYFMLRNV
ncbi:hypothetical protein O9H85_08260 [Paenibacillus filicis]|uniref:Bro-N domain-containing protein n=1 Tax=Paenibacillus gyeongsangnamensis TaxID=3388067 RepID=A0ABT4Q6C5_9BACL|nr:hypothetical protein [Paenibacillus filicis]MCZ8512426.1 hypothetical protein [Paenibacillus filicis]